MRSRRTISYLLVVALAVCPLAPAAVVEAIFFGRPSALISSAARVRPGTVNPDRVVETAPAVRSPNAAHDDTRVSRVAQPGPVTALAVPIVSVTLVPAPPRQRYHAPPDAPLAPRRRGREAPPPVRGPPARA